MLVLAHYVINIAVQGSRRLTSGLRMSDRFLTKCLQADPVLLGRGKEWRRYSCFRDMIFVEEHKLELKDAIRKRESVRDYEDRPVPEDKLLRVLEAARIAPSASNKQEWKFVVVKDANKRKELSLAAGGQPHLASAPVIIAAVATEPERVMKCGVPPYAVDLAIAIDHMTLAAVDEGLGTCWIGAFSQEQAREILKVPASCKVVTIMPLGFPKPSGRRKDRKLLNEIVCYETFRE
jgi:nitroreductase